MNKRVFVCVRVASVNISPWSVQNSILQKNIWSWTYTKKGEHISYFATFPFILHKTGLCLFRVTMRKYHMDS